MFAGIIFFFLFILNFIGLVKCDHRKEELKRISKHELVYFDIDNEQIANGTVFEFDAFNQHYIVELFENTKMIASNIKHTNGIPKHVEIKEYYTSLTKSCHFYGKILNDKTDPLQRVSLSLCNKRGVRGEIRAFNETLVIKPAKYYLDIEYDNNNFHNIKDEHLIWKYSDYDSSGIPELKGIHGHIDDNNNKIGEEMRRRMVYNGGSNNVELLIATDPPMANYYKQTYSSSWYQQLTADMADYVNVVSSKYGAIDWNYWDIGMISVYLVELEVIQEFTGWYSDLPPACLSYSECSKYDWCECTINGVDYLLKFNEYIKTYKDQSTFDNAQMITKYYFKSAGGYGWVAKICQTDYNVANVANNFGYKHLTVGGAHEMGHNFGCNHDGDGNNCGSGEGMMGGADEGFSYCSMQSIHEYFWTSGGLKCLGTGVRGETNNGGNNGGSCNGHTCVGLWYMEPSWDGNTLNNYYRYTGCDSNGFSYYTSDDNKYYLFRSANGNWNVGSVDHNRNDAYAFIYCSGHSNDVIGCQYNWNYARNNVWVKDTNVWTWKCDSAFTIEEDECDNNIKLFNDELCMQNGNNFIDLGYNETIWQIADGICRNNMPMYYFQIEDENVTFYLHYQQNHKWTINVNETFGEWVIKKDENYPFAYCKKENLFNCTGGSWYMFDINSDSLAFNIDNNMTIYNNKICEMHISQHSTNAEGMTPIEIISICLIILATLIIIVFGFIYYRHFKVSKNKHNQKKMKQVMDDEQEIEVEVPVSTQLTQTDD